jgi:predicted PurR-regulated permease PerM
MIAAGLAVGNGLAQVVLSVFLTFFIFRDGQVIGERLNSAIILIAGERGRRLLELAGGTVRGVVYGIIGTGLAQGGVAGIGFAIAGVPGAALLGLLTFFLSVLPVGPPLVWIPATIWLFSTSGTFWGVFMLVWGILVSCLDNVLKPWLISQGAHLPFIVIFIGVLGGALAFGFIGVFIGPTLLAVAYRLVVDWSATPVTVSIPKQEPQSPVVEKEIVSTNLTNLHESKAN